jgi:hypothetical protein
MATVFDKGVAGFTNFTLGADDENQVIILGLGLIILFHIDPLLAGRLGYGPCKLQATLKIDFDP